MEIDKSEKKAKTCKNLLENVEFSKLHYNFVPPWFTINFNADVHGTQRITQYYLMILQLFINSTSRLLVLFFSKIC